MLTIALTAHTQSVYVIDQFFFPSKDFQGLLQLENATPAFKKYQVSKMHCEAVEAMITSPKTTSDVGELLSKAHREEKELARDMLQSILSSVRYLARQGLALRGDDDAESNLIQLLQLRAEDNPPLIQWLQRSSGKYTSHENQNERLEIMAHHVLRKILGCMQ